MNPNQTAYPIGAPVLILPDDHTQTEARGVVSGYGHEWIFVKTADGEELVSVELLRRIA